MHKSVLLEEALEYLDCKEGQTILDCTVGGAGHAKEILKRVSPGGRLIGIDADEAAIEIAGSSLKDFKGAFRLVKENFRKLDKVLPDIGIEDVDGMLFDLGISSFQLDGPLRGFSFSTKAPLDMRMDVKSGIPVWKALCKMSEADIGGIIRDFGQDRYWRRIAKAIKTECRISPIKDTSRLADVIKSAVGRRRSARIHPATRTFQAFRIFINDELNALREALVKAPRFLKSGARLVVISFHSLEDRIAKHTFKAMAQEQVLRVLTKKPVTPSDAELAGNPRCRSSKLRAAERV